MGPLARRTSFLEQLDTVWYGSHFVEDINSTNWTATLTDTGTAAVGDAVNGIVLVTPSDGTVADNDEAYVSSPNEFLLFGTNRGIYIRCRLNFVETAAGIYNVGFGAMNAPTANTLIDDGGGPKVSGSTLAIYKTDGSSVWKCASACNGVSTVTTSNRAAVGSTWYDMEIFCEDWDGVSMEVSFKVDGTFLTDTNNAIIRHTVPIASATEMAIWVGAKLGAITNNDATSVDFLYGSQSRV